LSGLPKIVWAAVADQRNGVRLSEVAS